ncbi:RNAse P Rpr2/Rpp21/SNM1 subunit domain-containing protein [Nemania diffusa]|nr:RNAse P Rpr2/Rpp21/SNM1 subunit domain-containing protein [Nemania diffusa]
MAKPKTGSVPNKHLYSRLSYLHQAAGFLGSQVGNTPNFKPHPSATDSHEDEGTRLNAQKSTAPDRLRLNLARRLLTDLRATSLKSQIRLSPAIKHTICKLCDTPLIEGETSTSVVENKSKGCKKPWADVLVVRCNTCDGVRRFPVQVPRQKRRPQREQLLANTSKDGIKNHQLGDEQMGIVIKDD